MGTLKSMSPIEQQRITNLFEGKMVASAMLGAVMIMAVLSGGCATHTPPPEGLKITITSCPYQISPLDTATLVFADGTTKELTVSHEGTMDLSTGREKVAGKSIAEFKELLTNSFPDVVTINVTEFKNDRISVLGEVFHQIHTELGNGPMRLMDAVAAANGFTSLADKQHVRLVRENAGVVWTYEIDFRQLMRGENMQQNLIIKPGDVITVPRDFL
jgi:polysaccharide export outer membrane protein